MKLLYLTEHLSCSNYRSDSDSGFSYRELDKGDVYRVSNAKTNCTLFLIQGEVDCHLEEHQVLPMSRKHMLYIPQNMDVRIESVTASQCMLLFWNKNVTGCDKLFFHSLPTKVSYIDTNDGIILPIKTPLMNVLKSVKQYLDAKMLCMHLHLLKQEELLLVLRGFYSKQDLAAFFSTSTSIRKPFEKFVLENYTKTSSIKELASLCHISERSFNRKFHASFGESPYQWIQKKKSEQIQEMINDEAFSFKEIAEKFDFSTSSHFTAYCQRMFGMSPSQLRNANKDKFNS